MTDKPDQPDEFSMSDAPEASDALADRMSDALAKPSEPPPGGAPSAEPVLEEEKVKD
jgi:hypothetical protein